MAAQQSSGGSGLGGRLEKLVRDSAELRAWAQQVRQPATSEASTLRRYRRSRTGEVALPHPALTARHHAVIEQRRQVLMRRMLAASLAVPLVITLGVLLGPAVVQAAVLALLVPLAGLLVHHGRELAVLEKERHLTLRGGLADAWSDWLRATAEIESLEHASQARAALGVNEARMHHLVLALGSAEQQSDHSDTEEHRASRAWVYETAARAVALAAAERELERTTRLEVDADQLRIAPEGDAEALADALEAARALARERGEQPPGPQ